MLIFRCMKNKQQEILEIIVKNQTDWRKWLEENHLRADSIFLVLFKKTSARRNLTTDEAIDEALCFGWIDSVPKKRDDESFCILFSKRNPKSNWSAVNKRKVESLLQSGRMQAEGLRMVELAKKTGTWTALDEVESLIVPPDLKQAFDALPQAFVYWEEFPRSVKRGILEWINNAKKPETRRARVEDTVQKALENIRANYPRQPKGGGK